MAEHGSCQKIYPNDPEVLEKLIHTYSDALVRYAYCQMGNAAAAEDIMEDAFAALLFQKLSFHSMEQVRSWLYKCVHGKAVDYRRKHWREVPLCDVENVLSISSMEENYEQRERSTLVYRCMQYLPTQYRQVLALNYFDGFSVPEICQILDRNPKQIYNLLSRAKSTLKEILLKEGFCYEEL